MNGPRAPQARSLPPSPYGSPPIYLPFSAVEPPFFQVPSVFTSAIGFEWGSYPFAPGCEPGWDQTLRRCRAAPSVWAEVIDMELPALTQDIIIPFMCEKVSPCLILNGPMILNVVDAEPYSGLSFTVINLSTSLIAIQLNALLPDKGSFLDPPVVTGVSNYRFRALVSVAP